MTIASNAPHTILGPGGDFTRELPAKAARDTHDDRVFSSMSPETAIDSNAFPCNPRPFAARIAELARLRGTDAIKSDAAKACLMVLVQQAYGQAVTLDTVEESIRLMKVVRTHLALERAAS